MTKTAVGAEEPDDENKPAYISGENIYISSTGSIFSGKISATNVTTTNPYVYNTLPPVPLFGNWVAKTKEMQESFFHQKFEDFTQEALEQWIRTNVLAAEDELHEALGEVSWKPWASAKYFNREAYLGEIVDVLHFVGNLLAGAGITDEELNAAYLAKMERNRQRQREGYTGTDKCAGCKRAVDDIEAHGGTMVMGDDESQWCDSCAGGPPVEDGSKE